MALKRRAASPGVAPSSTTPTAQPLYSASSQYRNWRYSKQGLAKVRNELNVQAVSRVRGMVEQERVQQHEAPSASSSTASGSEPPSRAPSPPPASEIQYLTVQDELSLVTYYLTQVSLLCGAFKFSEMVQATAMTYLKRFYLRNTCMDYHPKNVMLTCVFLATKTENHPISIDSFSSKTRTTPEDILSLEFLVSQSLRFEYKVHHAHLAASGLLLDMQTADVPLETLETVYAAAKQHLRTSRLTDLEFIYTPAQIALATFRLSDINSVESWIGAKSTRKTAHDATKALSATAEQELENDRLVDLLVEIGEVIMEAKENPVDKAKVTEVDKRLRWARNPEKDPKSAMYKKRKAEEEAQREAKSRAKAAARPSNDDESVFD